jgi:hypothetical protein
MRLVATVVGALLGAALSAAFPPGPVTVGVLLLILRRQQRRDTSRAQEFVMPRLLQRLLPQVVRQRTSVSPISGDSSSDDSKNQPTPLRPRELATTPTMIATMIQTKMVSIGSLPGPGDGAGGHCFCRSSSCRAPASVCSEGSKAPADCTLTQNGELSSPSPQPVRRWPRKTALAARRRIF